MTTDQRIRSYLNQRNVARQRTYNALTAKQKRRVNKKWKQRLDTPDY